MWLNVQSWKLVYATWVMHFACYRTKKTNRKFKLIKAWSCLKSKSTYYYIHQTRRRHSLSFRKLYHIRVSTPQVICKIYILCYLSSGIWMARSRIYSSLKFYVQYIFHSEHFVQKLFTILRFKWINFTQNLVFTHFH